MKQRFNLMLPSDLKEQLEAIAKQENRSIANLIVTILKDFLSRRPL